jgi:uncharacterized membrane protein
MSPATSAAPAAQPQRMRVFALVVAVVCLNAFGNLALAWGMRHAPEVVVNHPLSYIRPLLQPMVTGGVVLLILWLLTRMTLLSWADLSFVLPLTSFGYVLAAVLGHFFLNESVTLSHWIGTALIFAGTLLVSTTNAQTGAAAH